MSLTSAFKLSNLIQQNLDEVQDTLWATEPYSVFEDYGDFQILILRRIEVEDETIGFKPESFVLRRDGIFYLNRETETFSKLANGWKDLYRQLEIYYKNNQKIITAYSGQIEKLEDYLFERKIPGFFMDIWFDVKKDLSKLENYYYRNGIVYREFIKKMDSQFGDWKDEFKDIEDSIQFQTSNIGTLKSRLDGVHHYFDSIKHDGLNKTLLSLTLISGVFLPLNLIVGYFGINTPGLPLLHDPLGSEKVLLILAGVLTFCLMGFKIIRLLDRYILRFLIGRYDFYKNISARLDELSERLRGKRLSKHR